MAVVNTKSNVVTNADASPPVNSAALIGNARLRSQVGTVEVAAADDDTSVYRMLRVFSSWRIETLQLLNDAITGGTSFDFGVYQTNDNGGAVVSATTFASAVDLSSARGQTGFLDVTYEATATDIDKVEQPLWQRLGLTADPGRWYDIAATANTVGSGAGTISLRCNFVDGT